MADDGATITPRTIRAIGDQLRRIRSNSRDDASDRRPDSLVGMWVKLGTAVAFSDNDSRFQYPWTQARPTIEGFDDMPDGLAGVIADNTHALNPAEADNANGDGAAPLVDGTYVYLLHTPTYDDVTDPDAPVWLFGRRILTGGDAGLKLIPVILTGNTSIGDNRWSYAGTAIGAADTSHNIAAASGGTTYSPIFNGMENSNTSTGRQHNGWTPSSGFTMQPIQTGAVVLIWPAKDCDGNAIFLMSVPNGVDGSCP